MDGWVHVHHSPGEEMTADSLWEDGKLREAVLCSGQRSAGKPWVLASLEFYFVTYHLPKDYCRPPLLPLVLPDGSGLLQQDNTPCHTAKIVQGCFEEHDREFKVLTWPTNSLNLNRDWTSIGWPGPTNAIHGGPTFNLQDLKNLHKWSRKKIAMWKSVRMFKCCILDPCKAPAVQVHLDDTHFSFRQTLTGSVLLI